MSIFSKHKILVFDESVFMGKLLHSILKGFDVGRVSLCHDMAKLKTLLSHKKYDCVFCDWSNWPDPKPECLDHIRNSSDVADSHVPVIICSGQTSIHQVVECRNLDARNLSQSPLRRPMCLTNCFLPFTTRENLSNRKVLSDRTGAGVTMCLPGWTAEKK